jgi:CRP/FNR family transcriptional regulator/CRP/FNR family cyclic AMP-dependent transcriptional regulator
MALVDLLQAAPVFSGLEDAVLEALAASMVKRTFAKGRILFYKDSPGNSLYLVEAGLVRIFVLSSSGQEATLNLHGPGECFGELALLDGAARSAAAIAVETTVAHVLARADFLRLLDSQPLLARHMVALLAQRLRQLTAHTESLAFLDVYGRLASCLLDLAEHHGAPRPKGVEINLKLTQTELASCVVAARESVNRAVGTFRDQGMIEVDGQVITILDPERLRALARR